MGESKAGKLGFKLPCDNKKEKNGEQMLQEFQENGLVRVPKLCSYNILIKQISCGERHTHLLSRDGYVYSMGSNWHGALGLSDNEQSLRQVTAPQLIPCLREIDQVATGTAHSLALDGMGRVFGWGKQDSGQIGVRITCSSQP